jgi:ATP-dependent helicase Lhr and Lhr-like helicase
VIVATSTLELRIDVGDLDRVIQLGAPRTVASVLQRLGRTGRRPDTSRNCLFLATSDMELLSAFALVRLLARGWVEPLRPPALPVPLAAQQLLARVLAEGRIGRSEWPGAFAAVAAAAGLGGALLDHVLAHMLERRILFEEAGGLQIGIEGERLFGRRHFIELTSMFLSEPLVQARWGQRLLGQLDPSSLLSRDGERPVVLLGGASWRVREVDWERRVVWVEPSTESGRSRWSGPGGALSLEVCRAIRSTLCQTAVPSEATRRASARLAELREDHWFVRERATTALEIPRTDRTRWFTWAGGRANAGLTRRLASPAFDRSRRTTAASRSRACTPHRCVLRCTPTAAMMTTRPSIPAALPRSSSTKRFRTPHSLGCVAPGTAIPTPSRRCSRRT